jgi:outer membrane receptor protein involved in Fe transport
LSVSLRGANAEHTLVAIDGVRQNSAQNGTFDLSTVPLEFADRIEVARGAASAVYGSNAVGGVVNVLTPDPTRLGAAVSGGLGSFGRSGLDFRHTNWVAPVGYLVAGELYSARNDFTYSEAESTRQLANADIAREALMAKGRYQSGPHYGSILAEFGTTRRGVPGTVQLPSDSARRDDWRGQVIARYTVQPSGRLRTSAHAHASTDWQNYRDPLWGANDTHRLSDGGVAVEQYWQLLRSIGLTGALEYEAERLQSTAVGSPRRGGLAATFQFRVQVHGFDVTHILRWDRIASRAKLADSVERRALLRAISPKVMATWSGLAPFEFFTAVGQGFRAPSFNDLYWPADAFSYGNPGLRPEYGQTVELAAAARLSRVARVRLGAYWNSLTDLIQWQPDSAFRFRPVNVQSAQIIGLELEGRAALGPAELELAGAWTSARSESLALIYRPALSGTVRGGWRIPVPVLAPQLSVGIEYTGPRFSDPANTDTLAGYLIVDAGLRLRPRLGPVKLDLETGLRNLLDERYETTRGYPTPGRNWFLELGLEI